MAVRFTAKGLPLSEAVVSAVEAELGVALPVDYRTFLLEHNGGVPKPNSLFTKNAKEMIVQWFYSVSAKRPERDVVSMTLHFRDELELPKQYVPVAALENEDILLIQVAGKSIGRVIWWSFIEGGFDRERLEIVGKSFAQLIRALEDSFQPPPAATIRKAWQQLDHAILSNDLKKARALASGLDLTRVPKGCCHPIFAAIDAKSVEALRLLLELGSTLNCRNLAGETPLEDARSSLEIYSHVYEQGKKGNKYVNLREAEQDFNAITSIVELLKQS